MAAGGGEEDQSERRSHALNLPSRSKARDAV
jgi:hypothetical protein